MLHSTSQSLAAAALAFLPGQPGASTPHHESTTSAAHQLILSQCGPRDGISDAVPKTPLHDSSRQLPQPNMVDSKASAMPHVKDEDATNHEKQVVMLQPTVPIHPPALPSLLRYVDNDLLRHRSVWDRPPLADARCQLCGLVHDQATFKSPFLPLTPCGCWVHYRCFVINIACASEIKDSCPMCGTRLFFWEGIAVLTLATRTNISMADTRFPFEQWYLDPDTAHHVTSDSTAYDSDCALIEMLIAKRFTDFFQPGAPPPPYADGSPDLKGLFYGILEDLDKAGRPLAKWLSFSRTGIQDGSSGFFLFGSLVALKIRRFLIEGQAKILATEAWADFENTREEIQKKILNEVRGDGWSWADTGR